MKKQPDIDGFTVQHLPIISAYARRIGVLDIINTLVPTEMAIDAGTVILYSNSEQYPGGRRGWQKWFFP